MLTALNFWTLMIYWLAMFVSSYIIIEVAQDQLYDEVTPWVGLKVLGGSLVMAIFLTWLHPSFETMFTANIAWTVLLGIVWFAVFTLIFRFHPTHAATIGLLSMLVIPALATLGVDSVMTKQPAVARTSGSQIPTKPVRASIGGPMKTEVAPKTEAAPKK